MNVQEIEAAMTRDEIKARGEGSEAFFKLAGKLRGLFEDAVTEHGWDEDQAGERLASVVFGDGTDGTEPITGP